MKANEVRIGNIIKNFAGIIPCDVDEIIDMQNHEINDYYPVELNSEWLIKFGFKREISNRKVINFYIRASYYFNSVHWDAEEEEWYFNNDVSDAECYGIRSIKYVHELQNIYHAINGVDLILENTNL